MIYLDNAASTPCLPCVMDAMRDANKQWSNVHRGLHRYADHTTTAYEEARQRVANFIDAKPDNIAFTSGTTDSLNMVANGLDLVSGDCVLVTQMDHHSNILPWEAIGCRVRYAPVVNGELDLDKFEWLLGKYHPKVVAFPGVSNVLGTVNPATSISKMAHAYEAIVVMDAAQSIAHMKHYANYLGVDYMAFSGHKMGGPTGVGVLYGKNLDRLRPSRYGGGMIANINPPLSTTKSAPHKLEAGTPPIQQAIGLGEACRFWSKIPPTKKFVHIENLTGYAYEHLANTRGINILGPPKRKRIGIISFTVDGIHAHDVAALLGERGIAVRAGHHCAQPLHDALDIKASVRVSFSYFNKASDVDALVNALKEIQKEFK